MRRSAFLALGVSFLLAIGLLPLPGGAVLPVLAMLGKQIIQNIVIGSVKGQLIGSLAGMGCKGAHIAGLIASADAARGMGRGMGGLPGGGGMPGGGALPGGGGMPGGGASGPISGAMNGAMNGAADGRGLRAARGGVGILNAPPGGGSMDPAMMAQVMAMAQQQAGMNAPAMTPEQMAQVQQTMAAMQGAMANPLSREETLGVFDELGDLGLLTDSMRSEARDCIMLAPPGSDAQVGATGALIKTTVLPRLREAKQRLANLTPEEQDQLAQSMIEELQKASAADRKAFLDGLGVGFFPAPVVEKVQAGVAAR
jgi:hypothetical protein